MSWTKIQGHLVSVYNKIKSLFYSVLCLCGDTEGFEYNFLEPSSEGPHLWGLSVFLLLFSWFSGFLPMLQIHAVRFIGHSKFPRDVMDRRPVQGGARLLQRLAPACPKPAQGLNEWACRYLYGNQIRQFCSTYNVTTKGQNNFLV